MRAIDADVFKNRLEWMAYDDWNQGISVSFSDACNKIIEMIEEEPTIEMIEEESTIELPKQPQEKLSFSERRKIVHSYYDWCFNNNALDCAQTFLSYLCIKGYI